MLNVSVRPQPAAVAALSALAATAGETSSDEFLVEQIAAGSKPAMHALFARHRKRRAGAWHNRSWNVGQAGRAR